MGLFCGFRVCGFVLLFSFLGIVGNIWFKCW